MKYFFFSPIYLLLFLWEFPQNLMGIYYLRIFKRHNLIQAYTLEQFRFFIKLKKRGASFGFFVFWSTEYVDNKRHEFGHAIQSMILGPLYIPVIVFPSMMRYRYSLKHYREHNEKWNNYYNGFPENMADWLGGVTER